MNPQNLTWDEAIYPCSAVNRKTVEAYVEDLSIGAQFPPVKVQQVVNYTPGRDLLAIVLIIIDGVHRWFALTEAGRTGTTLAFLNADQTHPGHHRQNLVNRPTNAGVTNDTP